MARLKDTHSAWLEPLQPRGLVVTATALADYMVELDESKSTQERFLAHCRVGSDATTLSPDAFIDMACDVLSYQREDFVMREALEDKFDVALPEFEDVLSPDFALQDEMVPDGDELPRWVALGMMVREEQGIDAQDKDAGWGVSPHERLERLCRENTVPIGLLLHADTIRLLYCPTGEAAGTLDFPITYLATTQGRAALAGFVSLLSYERVLGLRSSGDDLLGLLRDSRRFEHDVSSQLADQVLDALYILVRGFQSANARSRGELLDELGQTDPQHIYGGLLAILLRTIFLLFAEDRGLLGQDDVYTQSYSLHALFTKLRQDRALHQDTMDQRFGAFAQILSVFRLVYQGAKWRDEMMPPRHGDLFDPDTYPFLEGRVHQHDAIEPPAVSDQVVLEILERLLVLDKQRLSYRTLAVEQIGSVYEHMMGFELIITKSEAVALKLNKLPVFVQTHELFAAKDRAKFIQNTTGLKSKITGAAKKSLDEAEDGADVIAALGKRIHKQTPVALPEGSMVLQPGEDRRNSGSHYTPRALTEPIVRHTLEPVLADMGDNPRPEDILALKVCDPAMGSGAFLVEATRYLADRLIDAWKEHGEHEDIDKEHDRVLFARRLVSQRCIYGVDKNPFAVNLAKLSLWLFTMAREQPFTFVDHALRCGDALVGLSSDQLIDATWDPKHAGGFEITRSRLMKAVDGAAALRSLILRKAEDDDHDEKAELLAEAERNLDEARMIGDALLWSFFAESSKKARVDKLKQVQCHLLNLDNEDSKARLCTNARSMRALHQPFHWFIEFPEVFRNARGFDAFIGNPPFAGKNTIIAGNGDAYIPWLQTVHRNSHGNADLVAHFFRRCFCLLRPAGSMGLIATNTIAQGDTRSTGLQHICTSGGQIYRADTRRVWPGQAAVIVSVVHIKKSTTVKCVLDGEPVEQITAFLFHQGGHRDPVKLVENAGISYSGAIVLGMGFTFDDTTDKASPLAMMDELIAKDPRNQELIFPYLGGKELNSSPTHEHHRFVINFGARSLAEAQQWPDLLEIVEEKVKPERDLKKRSASRDHWWHFGEKRPALFNELKKVQRCLAAAQTTVHLGFCFKETDVVLAGPNTNVFIFERFSSFAIMQSSIHEIWARFLSSSLEDRMRYTPSTCFETFPAPIVWDSAHTELDDIGEEYYNHRAQLMIDATERLGKDYGMTKAYNDFHNPNVHSSDINELRRLHDEMDRAVLRAYGWDDIDTSCTWQTLPGGKKYRWQWPDEVRFEVLSRLMGLNADRAANQ